MKNDAARLEARLKEARLRRTPMRLAILDVLIHSDEPLGAAQIQARLPAGTDLVTVYRTLRTFTEKSLAHRVRGEDQTWRYALGKPVDRARHRHPHFVCNDCGTVACMDEVAIPSRFVRSLHVGRQYEVSWPEVILHGLCPKCATG